MPGSLVRFVVDACRQLVDGGLASRDVGLKPKISQLLPDDIVVTLEIPGGGGFGSPLERDPERVLDDVRDGYVSIEAAKSDYGVVIDTKTWSVDQAETAGLREDLARESRGSGPGSRQA